VTEIKEGATVKCAFCRKDVKVEFVVEHGGNTAYSLSCFHRNTFCPTCDQMARDASETIHEVRRHCDACDGPFYDDDDDEE
jgi:hypothetical protein